MILGLEGGPSSMAAARDDLASVAPGTQHHKPPLARPVTPRQFCAVTETLFSRLSPVDVATVAATVAAADRQILQRLQDNPIEYKRAILRFGARYGVTDVVAKTGLTSATPPLNVHSMSREGWPLEGGLYYADLVIGAAQQVGAELPARARILDFGCSSGRVIRALRAYGAGFACHGCDPSEEAIEWARANLPNIAFAASPLRPPLTYVQAEFDLVFAISIWSHMNQTSAKAWLTEMRRIVRPGGLLLLTFHGLTSVNYFVIHGRRPVARQQRVQAALIKKGFVFVNIYGDKADWGLKDPEWGEAYLTLRWLEENTKGDWELRYYQAGVVAGNQDLVLMMAR